MVGVVGAPYCLLTSTNLAVSATNWTRLLTNVFGAGATFTDSVPMNPTEAARFYLLQAVQ